MSCPLLFFRRSSVETFVNVTGVLLPALTALTITSPVTIASGSRNASASVSPLSSTTLSTLLYPTKENRTLWMPSFRPSITYVPSAPATAPKKVPGTDTEAPGRGLPTGFVTFPLITDLSCMANMLCDIKNQARIIKLNSLLMIHNFKRQ